MAKIFLFPMYQQPTKDHNQSDLHKKTNQPTLRIQPNNQTSCIARIWQKITKFDNKIKHYMSNITSLEEPSDDSNITSVSGLRADGSGFVESERRDKPDGPTKMLKLPIVNSIS
jgi:hypothetical protein